MIRKVEINPFSFHDTHKIDSEVNTTSNLLNIKSAHKDIRINAQLPHHLLSTEELPLLNDSSSKLVIQETNLGT